MPDYVGLLLKAVNDYNDDVVESKNALRDLVCVVSEDVEAKNDLIIRSLLYTASQKMRVFGYNYKNNFSSDPDILATDLSDLKNALILENYRSKVRKNNILDKTQKELIEFYQSLETKRMLVSAPTSYGKTFIMREILYLNNVRYNNVLLVFPTVALLRENALNMEELNRELNMGYNVIKSIDGEVDTEARNIFVFTPERAMQLLAIYPNIKLDFFFYDEMYKIDEDFCSDELDEKDDDDEPEVKAKKDKPASFLDEARAKTFRICLYLLSKQVAEYYLAGPNLNKDSFGYGMSVFLNKNNIQVKEVTFEPTKRIRVDAYGTKIKEDLSFLPILTAPEEKKLQTKVNDKLSDIIQYIKDNEYGQSMLYCKSPAKANEYASKLVENALGKNIQDVRYKLFLAHLKSKYDISGSIKEWSLIRVLEKGFAMHHGKLPKYVQKEILDLFNRNCFDLLFCTSTIVEGVNTNARNIIILNDKKGSEPLTTFDLKNIIGRAGRYYHNFIGRYFLFRNELVKIIENDNLVLDFKTYSNGELDVDKDAVDLDNANYVDLTSTNQSHQINRIEKQKEYILPNEVFIKNRLIKKEYQEKLLRQLLSKTDDFWSFYRQLSFPSLFVQFTNWNAMNVVLKIYQSAGLLDELTVKRFTAVSNNYNEHGFRGILAHEISRLRDTSKRKGRYAPKTVDQAYTNAFKTQKEIIEHKFPQLLTLFESIFTCAAQKHSCNIDNFSLAKIIRYYETGVRSYLGEQLVEFGFPTDTIREIEKVHPDLIAANAEITKTYIKHHHSDILTLLDGYEQGIYADAVKSLN